MERIGDVSTGMSRPSLDLAPDGSDSSFRESARCSLGLGYVGSSKAALTIAVKTSLFVKESKTDCSLRAKIFVSSCKHKPPLF